MSTTLSFGYEKPDAGDKGDPLFTALEGNIQQLNDHKHDGANSDRADSFNLSRSTVAVPNTGWSADGSLFKQTVTFPADFSAANGSEFGNASLRFYYDGGSDNLNELFPKYERLTDTTFELFSVVSNQAYTVAFL
jgi:hypothetical protein